MAACYENHVKFQERLFCRDPNNPNAIPTPFVTGDNQISTAPSFIKPSEDNDQIVQTTTPDGQSIYTYKQKLQAYQAQQEQQQAQQRAQAQQLAQQAAHEAETKPQQQIQQEVNKFMILLKKSDFLLNQLIVYHNLNHYQNYLLQNLSQLLLVEEEYLKVVQHLNIVDLILQKEKYFYFRIFSCMLNLIVGTI